MYILKISLSNVELKMKILVAYFSRTGNTKRVAQAIYDEIQCEKEIKSIDDDLSLKDYDFIFLGFPIESYGPPTSIHKFLSLKTKQKNFALFITHGVPEGQELLPLWIENCKKLIHPTAKVKEIFTCQGEVAEYVVDSLRKSPNPMLQVWAEHCHLSKGQPDESRIQKAKEFARKTLD